MEIVNIPIKVYSVFDYSKEIKPIKFFKMSEGDKESIKIKRLIRRDKEKIAGEYVTTFTCELITEDGRKFCDIRYNHASNTWILYRI